MYSFNTITDLDCRQTIHAHALCIHVVTVWELLQLFFKDTNVSIYPVSSGSRDRDRGQTVDPTVNSQLLVHDFLYAELQRIAADMFGMEAALFVPTGTMSNLIAGELSYDWQ